MALETSSETMRPQGIAASIDTGTDTVELLIDTLAGTMGVPSLIRSTSSETYSTRSRTERSPHL